MDALVLLEDVTARDRGWLLAHPEFELAPHSVATLNALVERRKLHEPLAYIRGKSEFYGREFIVSMATLQPRAETETMVDELKKLDIIDPIIIDIGTGSGCLAVTAKLELPGSKVYATEINDDALSIAKQNAKKLQADVNFYEGNLLEPVLNDGVSPTVLMCNLPYVPDSYAINRPAMQEPKVAIFGGADGLDLYRELFDQISKNATTVQFVLTESLPFQHTTLAEIARSHGFIQINALDFIQVFKFSTNFAW